jgi:bile acid-coenzyme A ligase
VTTVSFPQALARLVAADPDFVAVTCGDETLTRLELDLASNRMARGYADLGVRHGDLVTIALGNGPEWFIACMAVWKLGAVPNPISRSLPAPEREAIIERARPALLVGHAADVVPGTTSVPAGFEPPPGTSDAPLPDALSPIERALASGGSTGLPKLICSQAPAEYDPQAPLGMFTARHCVLIPGPLYHGIPYSSAWRSLLGGAKVVVMPRFDASACLELIERHRVDKVTFVPTMMLRISRLPEAERAVRDVSSLEVVMTSGAPCPAWLMQTWIDWLGPDVMNETFGSTERIGGTTITGREWLAHPGSVGRPAGGSRIRIVDPETGLDCPAGVMGEIYMLPPGGPGTTYEYVGAQAQTDADGWETVGDMGYLDADGYLYLGDRRLDMILSRGRNIYPAEIEGVLDAHPLVTSSAVIGLPDEDLGQAIHAIVQADGVTAAELSDHVRAHLASYKVPRTFEFVGFPLRNDSGKVSRSALRAERIG